MPRPEVMCHLVDGNNIALVSARSNQSSEMNHFFVSDCLVETKCGERTSQSTTFPLWAKPSAGEGHRRPNIDRNLALTFGKAINLTYKDGMLRGEQKSFGTEYRKQKPKQESLLETAWDGRGDLRNNFGPRDLFDWIYAVLHAPSYRARYAEFLKSDFPRIPTPGSRALFEKLVKLGAELVALHLLKSEEAPILKELDINLHGKGEPRVAKGYPKYENGKVMINATRWFEDVPEATWNFQVGGYQVLDRWLTDRAEKGGKKPKPGRVLTEDDILHYRRVAVALTETRRLMAEIDKVIESHGGWPAAFAKTEPMVN
jgi:Type ISP C-terminal specificity domain